jgi:hypothetical protein
MQQVGLTGLQKFHHLFPLHGPLQDDPTGPEIAGLVLSQGAFTGKRHIKFEHPPTALRAIAQGFLSFKIGHFDFPGCIGSLLTEVEFNGVVLP